MKLTGTAVPPDSKAVYREIAKAALEAVEGQAAVVELYAATAGGGDVTVPAPDQAEIDKLVQQLRAGIASVDMGRFTVKRADNLAYVSVNIAPVKARKVKKSPPAPKVPAEKPAVKK